MNAEHAVDLLYAEGWRLVGGYETESGTWLCCWSRSGRQAEGSGVTPANALLFVGVGLLWWATREAH